MEESLRKCEELLSISGLCYLRRKMKLGDDVLKSYIIF